MKSFNKANFEENRFPPAIKEVGSFFCNGFIVTGVNISSRENLFSLKETTGP